MLENNYWTDKTLDSDLVNNNLCYYTDNDNVNTQTDAEIKIFNFTPTGTVNSGTWTINPGYSGSQSGTEIPTAGIQIE